MAAVRSERRNFQDDINRACNGTLEDCFDLMQIYDQDLGSYIKCSAKSGAAQQFIRDINRGETTQESLVVEKILIQSRQDIQRPMQRALRQPPTASISNDRTFCRPWKDKY